MPPHFGTFSRVYLKEVPGIDGEAHEFLHEGFRKCKDLLPNPYEIEQSVCWEAFIYLKFCIIYLDLKNEY